MRIENLLRQAVPDAYILSTFVFSVNSKTVCVIVWSGWPDFFHALCIDGVGFTTPERTIEFRVLEYVALRELSRLQQIPRGHMVPLPKYL